MTHARILATAALAITTATGAAAGTLDLTYQGPSASSTENVTINAAPVGGTGDTVGAYGFDMEADDGGVVFDILAWCLDLEANLGAQDTAEPYHITKTPYSNSTGLTGAERARVQSMFDANFETLDPSDGVEAAGFQVALWNTLFDGDMDAGTGAFAVSASNGDVITTANGFLTDAGNYTGDKKFNMTFYESTGTGNDRRQNLVSVSPVPLPAALWMLAGALGGLGALRRFRAA